MHFKDVIGQTDIKNGLLRLVESDRLPHAMLFLGPEGAGTLPAALAFAQYLLCTDRQEQDSCGHCNSCHKVSKYIHPDLHFSFPYVNPPKKSVTCDHYLESWRKNLLQNPYMSLNHWLQEIGAENKQGNIYRDECNAIIKKLSLRIFEGSHKVLILWMAEYLGAEGNRLLKLIEEPPENTVIILLAEDQEQILSTILSRCQLIRFGALSDVDLEAALQQRFGISEEKAQSIAHLSNGNFAEATALMESEESDFAEFFVNWLRTCYLGNGVELVNYVNQIAPMGREAQKHFLKYGLHFLRELLLIRLGSPKPARLRSAELPVAANLAKVVDERQIEAISRALSEAIFHVERNANPKVLFLDVSINIHKIFKPLEAPVAG